MKDEDQKFNTMQYHAFRENVGHIGFSPERPRYIDYRGFGSVYVLAYGIMDYWFTIFDAAKIAGVHVDEIMDLISREEMDDDWTSFLFKDEQSVTRTIFILSDQGLDYVMMTISPWKREFHLSMYDKSEKTGLAKYVNQFIDKSVFDDESEDD